MDTERASEKTTRRQVVAMIGAVLAFVASLRVAYAQQNSGFPDGYDAVQAAPHSHKVIFENSLVRVLEVLIPSPGATEPFHHHRWPSFFLDWDTGGKTPHVHYLRPDGSVRDEPSTDRPIHSGRWSVKWMKPEPMHAIQVIDRPETAPNSPPLLRVEIKCGS